MSSTWSYYLQFQLSCYKSSLSSVLTPLLQVNLLLYLYSRKKQKNTGMDNFYKTLKLGSLWQGLFRGMIFVTQDTVVFPSKYMFFISNKWTCSLFPTNRHVFFRQQIDMFFISNKQTCSLFPTKKECSLFPTNRHVLYFQQIDMFFISNK